MKRVLVTGASGFIGRAVCRRLSGGYDVIGTYNGSSPCNMDNVVWKRIDLENKSAVAEFLTECRPDWIIHCAGKSAQRIGTKDSGSLFGLNTEVTGYLAEKGFAVNPDLNFIFLSSVSVYGDGKKEKPFAESDRCAPETDYARSKLEAEKRLRGSEHKGKCLILRLAPVYDSGHINNIAKRVSGPLGLFFVKYGSGRQRLSAVSRSNVSDFIAFSMDKEAMLKKVDIINLSDADDYSFNEIIRILRCSGIMTFGFALYMPLRIVDSASRVAGLILPSKRTVLSSFFNKLSESFVCENTKMTLTGFKPRQSLRTVFSPGEGH